jgi:hypothetical protein
MGQREEVKMDIAAIYDHLWLSDSFVLTLLFHLILTYSPVS